MHFVLISVPAEEPTLVEYFTEASRSDLLSSASSHRRPVTVVVCQSGEQLKFFQFMPGSDVASPVSCSQRYTASLFSFVGAALRSVVWSGRSALDCLRISSRFCRVVQLNHFIL